MSQNILRQIVDIQAQAERLIRTEADIVEIDQFAQFNAEIMSYLHSHIDDPFVMKYVNEIPVLDIEEIETSTGITSILLGLFVGGSAIYNDKEKARKALIIIRDIKAKYASIEFMLKNHFAS
uniref:hypothetical protein n=2 Tax=Gelidibacter sp. TaxID=2018083 RepID=UPI0040493C14